MDRTSFAVRPYTAADERSWLRCRALAFLDTNYFDDVVPQKPTYDGISVGLVAVADDEVLGLLDVAVHGELATIETIATHPDHVRRGVAHRLLEEAVRVLPTEIVKIEAWTREDEAANAWYRASGFTETFAYLHVYAGGEEIAAATAARDEALTPVAAFFHANLEAEERMRREYHRVYRCRRYERAPA